MHFYPPFSPRGQILDPPLLKHKFLHTKHSFTYSIQFMCCFVDIKNKTMMGTNTTWKDGYCFFSGSVWHQSLHSVQCHSIMTWKNCVLIKDEFHFGWSHATLSEFFNRHIWRSHTITPSFHTFITANRRMATTTTQAVFFQKKS